MANLTLTLKEIDLIIGGITSPREPHQGVFDMCSGDINVEYLGENWGIKENRMSNINDRVAYLKGLAEGMKLTDETNEGKLLLKMLDAMQDMAEEITALRKDHDELDEYVESIDDDLADMEEYLYDEDDEDEGCSGCCGCGGDDDEEETDEDDDDQLVEYTCPHCGNEVTFEIDGFDLEEENLCPACGKPLFPIDGEDNEDSDQK